MSLKRLHSYQSFKYSIQEHAELHLGHHASKCVNTEVISNVCKVKLYV